MITFIYTTRLYLTYFTTGLRKSALLVENKLSSLVVLYKIWLKLLSSTPSASSPLVRVFVVSGDAVHPSDFLADVKSHRVAVQQPVPLPHILLQFGLSHSELADGRLHLLHLHLHQCDDVPLLVQFPQQLG